MLVTRSISILQKRCQKIFGTQSIVIMAPGLDLIWPNQNIVDVVILGNPLNFITQKHLWPLKMKIRLWVLCESNKKILTDIIGIRPEDISVIPRYLLFPVKKNSSFLGNFFDKDATLIYSGRLTHEKNFSLSVEVANVLQKISKSKITFTICAPNLNLKRKKEILVELNKYQWKYRPKILGDLGISWHKKIKDNPILLNLSTYRQEDFGVSVAQVQQIGWPIILSNWGGHRDVQDVNVIKISPELIISKKVLRIVQICLANRLPAKEHSNLKLMRPQSINYSQVEKEIKKISPKRLKNLQEIFFDDHLPNTKKLPKMISNILMGK